MILNIFSDIGNWVQKIWATVCSIGNTIQDICGFIGDFFSELVKVIGYIGKAKDILFSCFTDLPPFLLPFATATIFVLIIFQIVGRTGGAK